MLQMSPFAQPAQTSFESERSQFALPEPSAQDPAESEAASEEESDHGQDAIPRRSSRKRNCTQVVKDSDDQVST